MKRVALTVVCAAGLALPLPAMAQDLPPDEGEAMGDMQTVLTDPAKQAQMAATLRVLGEVLLDLPLAPLADAVETITGEPMTDITPDTTLRSIAPETSRLPEQLEEAAPRAMEAMGGMARALQTMAPALRDMARRLEGIAPPAE